VLVIPGALHWLDGISVDFIGRMERLPEDVTELFRLLGVEGLSMKHENKSERKDALQHYCLESKQIVETFYEKDFRTLGYATREFLSL
jgi:hypothetical protein